MTNDTEVQKTDAYITNSAFEGHMASIARSFAQMDERISFGFENVLREIQAMRHESREDRQTLGTLAYNDAKQGGRIGDLEGRVSMLERKP